MQNVKTLWSIDNPAIHLLSRLMVLLYVGNVMHDHLFSSFNASRPPELPMTLKKKIDALRQSRRTLSDLSIATFPTTTDVLSLFVLKIGIRESLHPHEG